MGRGRAKAKQTKVARDLKYRTMETDFSELQRELHGSDGDRGAALSSDDAEADDADPDAATSRHGYAGEESAAR